MTNTPTTREQLTNTRRKIVLTLKQRGEANAVELAEALYVTVSAIRQHLGRLTGEGLIAYREIGQGPGRRRRLYHLTPAAESLFPNGYEELLTRLMTFVQRENPAMLDRFLEDEWRWRSERARRGGPPAGIDAQIEGVAQLFARDSYLPEVDGAAGHEIQFQHCPIFAAARIYPRMCVAELEFIREQIPDGQVDRTAWRLDGASVCQYQVGTR
jgi:predicted ArsR family transcriptional regulator